MINARSSRFHDGRIAAAIAVAALALSLGACGARLSADQKAAAIAYGQGAHDGSQSADGSQGSNGTGGGTTGGTGGTTGGASGGTTGGVSGGAAGGSSGGGTTGGTGGKSTGGTTGGKTTGGTSGGTGGGSGGGTGGPGGPGSDTCTGTATGSSATGVSATSISLGNASDLSGPIGGLFSSAPQAVQAYIAYFNATHPNGICGRKLTVHSYDSQTSDAGDNQQTLTACQADFALVGSVSAF
ncbi:MAG TPA: hypothetical protein VGD91_04405, partial [Trebonia sp.]